MGVLLDQPRRRGSANVKPPEEHQDQSSERPQEAPSAARVKRPWYRIQTRYRWGWCFLCIMVWGSILSLDRLVTYSFQTLAANSFRKHSSLTFISLVRSVIAALAGPPFAILEQMAGSQVAWLVAIACYVAGHGATAGSTSVTSYTTGITFYELGANGCVILQQILVARVTSSRDRQLFSILPQLSFLIWAFISASIFSALSDHWRWGVGLFSILAPIPLLPLVGLLHYTPSPTRELPKASGTSSGGAPTRVQRWSSVLKAACSKADAVGLVLLGSGTAGILVPLLLAGPALAWARPEYLAPLLVSAVLVLPAFLVWQLRYAPHPLIPRFLFRSRTFLFGSMAEILFQASAAGMASYLPTYLYVVMGTSADAQQIVSSIFSFSYALGALPIALIVRYARSVKYIVVFGATLFTIGAGVMILRGSEDTPTLLRLVVSQVLMGLGASASMAVIPAMVQIDAQRRWTRSAGNDSSGIQWDDQDDSRNDTRLPRDESDDAISVVVSLRAGPESREDSSRSPAPLNLLDTDVGKAIAALSICQSIGAAIGNALSGTLWSTFTPRYLIEELTAVGAEDQMGSIFSAPLTWIVNHAIGTEEREAVIKGYNRVWQLIMILFTALLACSVLVALLIENLRLDDGVGQSLALAKPNGGPVKPSTSGALLVGEDQERGADREQGFVSDLLGQAFFQRVEGWVQRRFPRHSRSSRNANALGFRRRVTASPEPEDIRRGVASGSLQGDGVARDGEGEAGSRLQGRRPSKQDRADTIAV